MQEIWKDVVGYEGFYKVSNLGNIISCRRNYKEGVKYITPFNNGGYDRVTFVTNWKHKNLLVHRIVAEAFIPNPENKPDVNHIDGNKHNNCVNNLEWATRKENVNHAISSGLRPPTCPHNKDYKRGNGPRAKAVFQYDLNNHFIAKWDCAEDAADHVNGQKESIGRCCRGERQTHKGFIWKYF